MTAMSAAMPADLAEAVRSMPCGACQARREVAAAMDLVSQGDFAAAASTARPAPPGSAPGLAEVPELSGVVCAAAGHPLRWAAGVEPPWVHQDRLAGPSCAS